MPLLASGTPAEGDRPLQLDDQRSPPRDCDVDGEGGEVARILLAPDDGPQALGAGDAVERLKLGQQLFGRRRHFTSHQERS
jgi:hypothetical protein